MTATIGQDEWRSYDRIVVIFLFLYKNKSKKFFEGDCLSLLVADCGHH